ncbi:MAG: transcriptional repressor [Nitrospirae bacterium]|nr:transcriptional repressor [Nitrospirota bacterium]
MKELEILRDHISRNNMKHTRQREMILETFIKTGGHISAEDLYNKVSRKDTSIGLATVYRTLNLLCECGIAQQREFGEGYTLYEIVQDYKHHDHLICTTCGKIIEFEDCNIERLQEKVAQDNGFTIYTHKLEIYGLCKECGKPRET